VFATNTEIAIFSGRNIASKKSTKENSLKALILANIFAEKEETNTQANLLYALTNNQLNNNI